MLELTFESWIAGKYSLENQDDINLLGLDNWLNDQGYHEWYKHAEEYAEDKIKELKLLKQ